MRIIYSTGFSEEERRQARPVIFADFLNDFKDLLDFIDSEGIVFGTESVKVVAQYQSWFSSSFL